MFGDSLFSGTDVNAGATDSTGAFSSTNPNGYMQQPGDQGAFSSTNPNGGVGVEDPAQAAAMQAEQAANTDTAQADQNIAMSVSGGIGRTVGLFGSIEGLVGPRQKRLRKSQRVFSRAQAQAGVDNANRALAQYTEDSAREKQQLSQSYSGRGIGESSIEQEGMQYFNDTQARKMAALQQNINLAELGQRLTRSQISASYANTWTSFGNSLSNML